MNHVFDVFSPQQWQVLQALARYRFLTVEQMLHLGLSKNARSLRDKTLFALRHHGCIQSDKIGSFLPDVHYLTPRGGDVLRELEGRTDIAVPSPKRQAISALFAAHRFAQVDFQIGLQQWATARGDADVVLERQDFVHTPRPATELPDTTGDGPIIPDGVFAVENDASQQAVYVVEIHRATQSKAVAAQLARYYEVIQTELVQRTFDLTARPVICSVHHDPAVLKSVKARLQQMPNFALFQQNFVFHELHDLRDNFCTHWHLVDDTPADPFPIGKSSSDA